jgi:hypothetical protein
MGKTHPKSRKAEVAEISSRNGKNLLVQWQKEQKCTNLMAISSNCMQNLWNWIICLRNINLQIFLKGGNWIENYIFRGQWHAHTHAPHKHTNTHARTHARTHTQVSKYVTTGFSTVHIKSNLDWTRSRQAYCPGSFPTVHRILKIFSRTLRTRAERGRHSLRMHARLGGTFIGHHQLNTWN